MKIFCIIILLLSCTLAKADDPFLRLNTTQKFKQLDSLDALVSNDLELHLDATLRKPAFLKWDFLKKLNLRRGIIIGSAFGFAGGFAGWITFFGSTVVGGPAGILVTNWLYHTRNENIRALYGCGGGTCLGLIGGYFVFEFGGGLF